MKNRLWGDVDERKAFIAYGEEQPGHQIKVWEQRKKRRKCILLEIDMPAAVTRTQEFRVT